MIVTFETCPGYYEQEEDGRKNNTVRKIDSEDPRFKWMADGLVDHIQIVSSGNPEYNFRRDITDISFWEDIVIITWKHNNSQINL